MSTSSPAIMLMGPTASGKTDLAMQLCDSFPCEIISVDSALVYQGMDIGTAKPSAALLAKYPHALIDLCAPNNPYSAGQFLQDVTVEMQRIKQAGRIPLLVGGTMMYFNLLQHGCADLPSADASIRKSIQEDADKHGWPAMHARLAAIDAVAAQRIHYNDKQRISRALEINLLTQAAPSVLQENTKPMQSWRYLPMALWPDERSVLHRRIEQRFNTMLSAGWLDEVKSLHAQDDLHADLPAMRMVGYRQLWAYCDGVISYQAAKEKGLVATRQLAKRQLTWLRRWPDLRRLNMGAAAQVEAFAYLAEQLS